MEALKAAARATMEELNAEALLRAKSETVRLATRERQLAEDVWKRARQVAREAWAWARIQKEVP